MTVNGATVDFTGSPSPELGTFFTDVQVQVDVSTIAADRSSLLVSGLSGLAGLGSDTITFEPEITDLEFPAVAASRDAASWALLMNRIKTAVAEQYTGEAPIQLGFTFTDSSAVDPDLSGVDTTRTVALSAGYTAKNCLPAKTPKSPKQNNGEKTS